MAQLERVVALKQHLQQTDISLALHHLTQFCQLISNPDESTEKLMSEVLSKLIEAHYNKSLSRFEAEFDSEPLTHNTFVAISKYDKGAYAIKRINGSRLPEVRAAAVLNHPNIVRYHSSWLEAPYIYIQKELCDTEAPPKTVDSALAVARAVEFIHSQGFAHCHLKRAHLTFERVVKIDGDAKVRIENDPNACARDVAALGVLIQDWIEDSELIDEMVGTTNLSASDVVCRLEQLKNQ